MAQFTHDELEQAFRTYWRTGAVGEDWHAWASLFTEDCTYIEHWYGTIHGRAAVRAWIEPVMAKFLEIYTAYDWHVVDPEHGRVIVYMQNRRDRPGGGPPVDFPGITLLDYAGDGLWKKEEDFWSLRGREIAMKEYEEACAQYDPGHPKKGTRLDWGSGPEWTRGARSHAERQAVR